MKVRNYFKAGILLAVYWWTSQTSFATEQITIRGRFSMPGADGMTVQLFYCPDFYATTAPVERGTTLSAKVENGNFEFSIEKPSPFAYIRFRYGNPDSIWKSPSRNVLTSNLYLIGADSVISLTIGNDQCNFSERSKLLECQYKMHEFGFRNLKGIMESDDYLDFLKRQKAHYDSIYSEQLKILDQYEEIIDPVYLEVLKLDFFADKEQKNLKISEIEHMAIGLDYIQSNEPDKLMAYIKRNKAVLQYYLENYLFKQFDTSHAEIKVLSRSYANLLFEKQRYDISLGMRATNFDIRPSFSQLFDKISESYNGVLKEKILAYAFLKYYIKVSAKITEEDLDMALEEMKNKEYKSIVQRIKDSRGYGKPAFNFNLMDSSRKMVTQEMLKGKFVILDFWFTGCTGCSFLNKKMTPVYEHFQNNPDVVFVSISIDKDFDMWQKYGLKSGLYTHPGSLNLYTNGLGHNDPVIRYYDITGFPALILVNKEGRIVSGNPPKPVTPQSIRRFIDLVEQNL